MSSLLGGGGGGKALTLATSNMTFYVSTTGSDSNPGTLAKPFATVQHASNVAATFDWAQGTFTPTIQVLDGTYTPGVNTFLQPLPNIGISKGTVVGNLASPGNVIFSDLAGNGVFSAVGVDAFWRIGGLTFDSEGICVFAQSQGQIYLTHGDIQVNDSTGFGDVQLAFSQDWGLVIINGIAITFLTNAFFSFWEGLVFSQLSMLNCTINFVANSTASAFSIAAYHIIHIFRNMTFSNAGTLTCPQLRIQAYVGLITTNGLMTDIPGSSFGTADETCSLANPLGTIASFFGESFAGIPTGTQVPTSGWGVWKDTAGGGVYVVYNDAGVIKKVALV